ncbi:MAG: NADH:flavin oxidoreductase/NADH oxidase [Deferribacteraceae bacterium]|jgi:2,4-dienoyl-CoA reductase-like NADH-dependent reductase (Old Yellow Enzyme family)|nr:NADH:flavin oxidoreductase/NADH oxidase [Deferribacteraceae bacterium]
MGAKLFETIKIRNVEFKNKVFMSPMCQYSGVDGMITDWHFTHYISRAVGGVGAIILEATAVEDRGRISPYDLGLYNDNQKQLLTKLVSRVKEYDCKIGIQLAHAGRKASKDAPWKGDKFLTPQNGGWQTIAPSAIPFNKQSDIPKEMTKNDIDDVKKSFFSATERAISAGFDFIEIHMAHGYLLHEFLSPVTNKRSDEYGGSFENRMKLPLEIVKGVREIIGENIPLFVRISAVDWCAGGLEIEDTVKFSKKLRENGADLIDVSSGGLVEDAVIPFDYGYQTHFAYKIKSETGILTGAVGMITTPSQAEHILTTRQADIVLLGRTLLGNPYWTLHAAKELRYDIKWPNQYLRHF